jgi:hypothetical protein
LARSTPSTLRRPSQPIAIAIGTARLRLTPASRTRSCRASRIGDGQASSNARLASSAGLASRRLSMALMLEAEKPCPQGRPMTLYAGLDGGDKAKHLCVVDGEGSIPWRGACATEPEMLTFTLRKHVPGLVRAVLETGALSAFLRHGLTLRGFRPHASATATRAMRMMPWG